jgi:hypothetical protein
LTGFCRTATTANLGLQQHLLCSQYDGGDEPG